MTRLMRIKKNKTTKNTQNKTKPNTFSTLQIQRWQLLNQPQDPAAQEAPLTRTPAPSAHLIQFET